MDADGTDQRRLTDLDSNYETLVTWLPDGILLLSIDSPADELHGWYLASRSGKVLGRVDVLPTDICCGEGQVAFWQD